MKNIIKYIMDNEIDTKLYYFDKYRIPQSLSKLYSSTNIFNGTNHLSVGIV